MGRNEISELDNKIKAVPQNEILLAALRDGPIEALLNRNVETKTETTTLQRAGGVLQAETTDSATKAKSQLMIEGSAKYSPPALGWDGFHLDTQWKGDFTITHINGKERRVEKNNFSYVGGIFDDVMNRQDRSNVTLTRKDANGKPFQTYLPALSETLMENGRLVLDSNGQPKRIASPAGTEQNCGLDMSNSRGGNMDCNYLIRDAKFGKDISYNETHEKFPTGFYYRSVLRETTGKVLGIVEQSYSTDAQGNISSVRTSARKPEQLRKN
ncbi:MAG: hypothetical protein SGJ27_21550 [Candidatus Melainabacteria bacterium]|nr:hypothetical protein [Candidatus Melainabacteria bacterium]